MSFNLNFILNELIIYKPNLSKIHSTVFSVLVNFNIINILTSLSNLFCFYFQLWMGTHSNGPSKLVLSCSNETETSLSEWLYSNSKALGDKVLEKFDGKLPFLFKVLSVNKSLSIQAHPNKSHAEQLHSERPDIYRDPNHKPEMAIGQCLLVLCLYLGLYIVIKSITPILIWVNPRKWGWPDLPHSNSKLSNSHSPSHWIQGILLQTNTLALLLHFMHLPRLLSLSSLPLALHFKLHRFSQNMPIIPPQHIPVPSHSIRLCHLNHCFLQSQNLL